jgi:hypothetical protein
MGEVIRVEVLAQLIVPEVSIVVMGLYQLRSGAVTIE